MDTMEPQEKTTILDVGVTPDRSLPESNFLEKFYPYKNRLTATSIEDASWLEKAYPGLTFIQTSERELPFDNRQFDIVFCSAVLEHVGDRNRQRFFVRELLRVAEKFFIITPNRNFPVEFHTFLPLIHWLPQSVHQSILRRLGMNFWAETNNLNLLTPTTIKALFPEHLDIYLKRHYLLGIPSNIIVYG